MPVDLNIKTLIVAEQESYTTLAPVVRDLGSDLVLFADNTKDGHRLLQENPDIGLMIVDEFDGFYNHVLIRKRAQQPKLLDIPLILLTQDVTHLKLNIFREHLIKHILIKPFSKHDFFNKIEAIFNIGQPASRTIRSLVKKHKFFQDLKPHDLQQILELGYFKKFRKDEVLVHENGIVNKFGVILKGNIGVYRVDSKTEKVIQLNQLHTDHFLGESNFLSRVHSPTRVVALETSMVFMLPYFAFSLISDELRNTLYTRIIFDLAQKLRETSHKLFLVKND